MMSMTVDISNSLCFIINTILLFFMWCLKGHKSIIFWRIAISVAVFELAIYSIADQGYNLGYSFALFISCCIYPYISQNNTCESCGRRYYWKSLIKIKCGICNKR